MRSHIVSDCAGDGGRKAADRRMVIGRHGRARPQDVAESHAADRTMEHLRHAAGRIADRSDETVRAGGAAACQTRDGAA